MVGVGGIVSVGGTGGSGGGSTSGITSINSQLGPAITINGVNGIGVNTASNVITIDGVALSGLIGSGGGTQSGVIGVNGIDVQQVAGNFVVDAAAVSGLIVPSGGIGGINGQIGPHLELQGVNGAVVTVVSENSLIVDVSSLSGIIPALDGSGINAINGDTGPNIDLVGVNGITVTPLGGGEILIDGVATSGTLCHSESFTDVTSITITHNLSSRNVIINVFDSSDDKVLPDRVGVVDLNNVIIEFNRSQTGKVVIVACISDVSSTELLCEAKRYALLVN